MLFSKELTDGGDLIIGEAKGLAPLLQLTSDVLLPSRDDWILGCFFGSETRDAALLQGRLRSLRLERRPKQEDCQHTRGHQAKSAHDREGDGLSHHELECVRVHPHAMQKECQSMSVRGARSLRYLVVKGIVCSGQ